MNTNTRKIQPGRQAEITLNLHQKNLQQPQPECPSAQSEQLRKVLLTSRETEVLQSIVNGGNNTEICTNLNISLETVKSHVKSILQKLQAQNRTEAVIKALRANLVRLPNQRFNSK